MTMLCPKCSNVETKVVDSRTVENGHAIRRRRECEYCQHRFTTFERMGQTELMVSKRDGSKELYDRAKLKRAVMLSFAKRTTSLEEVDALLTNLEIARSAQWSEVTSQQIGEDMLRMLKELDIVAYVRFASVYKQFTNFKDFQEFIA